RQVPCVLKKGQISFHCSSLVHGSYQNRSNMMRRAVILNVQDGDNRYRPFWHNGKQIHHYLDRHCRTLADSSPDYTDPAVFPVIWRNTSNVA
ncbi:MAG: phytanoyl-CoA dioxygenase family protein, partial [Cyanobacteria bacterium P01_C01_bin.72]